MPLDPEGRAAVRGDNDPILMAADMFKPRSTDSFEQWARTRLKAWLNPAQKRINESIIKNRYTAVPSCHSAGKSFFSAMKTGHFIDSHTIGSAFVVTTAPTSAQIESVLWRELHRVHALAGLRGRLTRSGYPQWRVGDELIAFGRRPTEIASFQGIHSRFILIILDEADGIDEQLWIAADTLASSGHARVLAIGNPDSADSHFARVIRPNSGWNVVRIDGLRTPNFTRSGVAAFPELGQYMRDNGIPYADHEIADVPANIRAEWRDVLLSPEWVFERMQRWGVTRYIDEDGVARWREPALWLSKVRGRSPTEGSEGIIPLSWVERAMNRWMEWDAQGRPKKFGKVLLEGRQIYGCDVADSGKDETVISRRFGHCVEGLVRIGNQDTETTAKRLYGRLQNTAGSLAVVDGAGVGAGVVNRLRGLRLNVMSFIGASSAEGMRDITSEFTFANKRSAAYWNLRELLDPLNGPDDLMLPPDEDLKVDLSVPTWSVKPGAVIAMETKDKVKDKLRRSPDCGDTVAMTFWPDSSPAGEHRIFEHSGVPDYEDDWAPVAEEPRSPAERRKKRIERLVETEPSNNVFSYADSGGWDSEW
jgi:hypothetical protein